jgi:hypothetical protein
MAIFQKLYTDPCIFDRRLTAKEKRESGFPDLFREQAKFGKPLGQPGKRSWYYPQVAASIKNGRPVSEDDNGNGNAG